MATQVTEHKIYLFIINKPTNDIQQDLQGDTNGLLSGYGLVTKTYSVTVEHENSYYLTIQN